MGTNHMAKAIKHPGTPVPAPPYTVTLELNQREAEVLACVLGRIAGSLSGPRGETSDVYSALRKVGVAPSDEVQLTPAYVKLERRRG